MHRTCGVEFLKLAANEIPSPFTGAVGLTEPRAFNLMFQTYVGALQDAANVAYLRPETAQGIFANFKNVMDSTRVKMPFGIAQIGKAFRNEINPRNYTFRSREFEQMEIEFFCHPNESQQWYEYWRNVRLGWYESLGIKSDKLRPREQTEDERAHYSSACIDIEYLFPFSDEPQELEGVAHRGCYDLSAHGKHAKGKEDGLRRDGRRDQGAFRTARHRAVCRGRPLRAGHHHRGVHRGREPGQSGVHAFPSAAGPGQGGGVPPGGQGRATGNR
jgi:glycyl-tRNA synthetase (class II)